MTSEITRLGELWVIAAELFLSPHTIKSEMKPIYASSAPPPAPRQSPGPGN